MGINNSIELTKEEASKKLRKATIGFYFLIGVYVLAVILLWFFAAGQERDIWVSYLTAFYALNISIMPISMIHI